MERQNGHNTMLCKLDRSMESLVGCWFMPCLNPGDVASEYPLAPCAITHWGWVTHICVSKQTIIGSDNCLSPGRRQAIIWTNAGILLIGPFGTNFSGILIKIYIFSFKKMHLKMSSGNWQPFYLGLKVINQRRASLDSIRHGEVMTLKGFLHNCPLKWAIHRSLVQSPHKGTSNAEFHSYLCC